MKNIVKFIVTWKMISKIFFIILIGTITIMDQNNIEKAFGKRISRKILRSTDSCKAAKAAEGSCLNMSKLIALEFEIFGKVQGVFFRKHTLNKGKELGLRGWCKNTESGTVVGAVEGPIEKVKAMKTWLETKGSPMSRIDKAEFKNEKEITSFSHTDFVIVKAKKS